MSLSESEILAQIDAYLIASGWFVCKLAQDIRTRQQLAGFPDRIAFKAGSTLLIEGKAPGGQLRLTQTQFAADIAPHLRSTLHYVVAYDVADVAALFGDEVI
jgi:hypothetical protein